MILGRTVRRDGGLGGTAGAARPGLSAAGSGLSAAGSGLRAAALSAAGG